VKHQKMLQKIEQNLRKRNILMEAYNSTSQEYSPRPRGESLLRHSTPMTGSSIDSSTQSLNFPLMATSGIAEREREREREKPAHNKDTKNAKLERLRSARLIRRDPKATKLDI
jgi:hypothetical protein